MRSEVGQSFSEESVQHELAERLPGGQETHQEGVALVLVRNKTRLTPVSSESSFPA